MARGRLAFLLVALVIGVAFLWPEKRRKRPRAQNAARGFQMRTLPKPPPPAITLDARPATPSKTTQAAASRGPVIHVDLSVVDRATKAPIAGAQIRSRPLREGATWSAEELESLMSAVPSATTDALGSARLSAPKGPTWVVASLGDVFGSTELLPKEATARIEVRPSGDLAVRVVDDQGAPVAIDLWAYVAGNGSPLSASALRARSGDDGKVILRHARGWFGGSMRLEPDVLRERYAAKAIPHEPWPTRMVELRLPASGAIDVSLRDERAQPLAEPLPVVIELAGAQPSDDAEWWTSRTLTLSGGRASLERVELGHELRARWRLERDGPQHSTTFAGPKSRGERVAVELVADEVADAPREPNAREGGGDAGTPDFRELPSVAEGTVVDERGEPVSDATVAIERIGVASEGSSDVLPDLRVHCDGGRFVVRGAIGDARLALRVEAKGFAPAQPLEFEPGSRDLVVRLKRE